MGAFRRMSEKPTRPQAVNAVSNPIAELYAGSWEGFIGRRSELAAAIRSSGDRAAAKAVAALRKPTRGAWLVNLLVSREPDQVAEVFALGEELARAHRDADAAEMRRLSSMRGAVLDSLTQRAIGLGREQGYSANDTVGREVAETLQAAMADPALADKVLEGTLVATMRAAGFGPADVFAPALADVIPLRTEQHSEDAQSAPDSAPAADPTEVRRLERERGRAEGRLEEARERRDRAVSDEERARRDLDGAQAEVAELSGRVAEIAELLTAATAEHERALARESECGRTLAEHTTTRQTADADAARLAELIDELTARLAELGVSD